MNEETVYLYACYGALQSTRNVLDIMKKDECKNSIKRMEKEFEELNNQFKKLYLILDITIEIMIDFMNICSDLENSWIITPY